MIKEIVINANVLPLLDTLVEFHLDTDSNEFPKEDSIVGTFNNIPVRYFVEIDLTEDKYLYNSKAISEENLALFNPLLDKFKDINFNTCLTNGDRFYLTLSTEELMKLI